MQKRQEKAERKKQRALDKTSGPEIDWASAVNQPTPEEPETPEHPA